MEFDGESTSREVDRVVLEAQATVEALPEDCVLGDGGAYALLASAESGSSTTRTPKPEPKPKQHSGLSDLNSEESFATMLQNTNCSFMIGDSGCKVVLSKSLTMNSTSTVATVQDSEGVKIGYISTAAPLGSTLRLKATCSCHKQKGLPSCVCWVQYPKSNHVTPENRVDLFKSLCTWIADGTSTNREDHAHSSYTLRVAAGMKPRAPRTFVG